MIKNGDDTKNADAPEQIKPIQTSIGLLQGRDCIHLDYIEKDFNKLILTGEIASSLCTQYEGEKQWIPYEITFNEVILYQGCELDTYEQSNYSIPRVCSSFNERFNSCLMNNLNVRDDCNKESLHHYQFCTYDDVYDIIAKSYDLLFQ